MGIVMARRPSGNVVVDASVAVKWVLPEDHSEAALRVLESGVGMIAPAHWLAEAVNAVWTACRRTAITRDEIHQLVATLAEAPVASVPLNEIAATAMDLSLRADVSVYDALYIALALRDNAILITDDRRLLQAVHRDAAIQSKVRWIAEI
jgi:predicted nucleic acid-binding protein